MKIILDRNMKNIAIIKTGGKQYKVSEGDVIKVEKIKEAEGAKVKFPVLFFADEKDVLIGEPEVKKVEVVAEVVRQTRGKKLFGVKHKPKKRQLKKFGHKQPITEVKIEAISKK